MLSLPHATGKINSCSHSQNRSRRLPKKKRQLVNLVIDEGNTTVKVAVFDACEEPERVFTFKSPDTAEIMAAVCDYPVTAAIYSSVTAYDASLAEQLGRLTSRLTVMGHDTPLPIKIKYATPATLGVDRIAGAVAAWSARPGSDSFIIDAGTAITYDYVSSDGEYLGGNISPGITMRLKSLNHYTAGLPLVSKSTDYPERGDDTRSAILSGVMTGVISEAAAYIRRYSNKTPGLNVIITGGDSRIIFDKLNPELRAVAREDALLVLKGLNNILIYNSI